MTGSRRAGADWLGGSRAPAPAPAAGRRKPGGARPAPPAASCGPGRARRARSPFSPAPRLWSRDWFTQRHPRPCDGQPVTGVYGNGCQRRRPLPEFGASVIIGGGARAAPLPLSSVLASFLTGWPRSPEVRSLKLLPPRRWLRPRKTSCCRRGSRSCLKPAGSFWTKWKWRLSPPVPGGSRTRCPRD